MTISCSPERLIPLRDIPRLPWLPRRRAGSKLSYPTLWRWAMRGCAGVRLPVEYVGSSPCVTESALREFFGAVAAARRGDLPSPNQLGHRSPAKRQREIETARRKLAAAGI